MLIYSNILKVSCKWK